MLITEDVYLYDYQAVQLKKFAFDLGIPEPEALGIILNSGTKSLRKKIRNSEVEVSLETS